MLALAANWLETARSSGEAPLYLVSIETLLSSTWRTFRFVSGSRFFENGAERCAPSVASVDSIESDLDPVTRECSLNNQTVVIIGDHIRRIASTRHLIGKKLTVHLVYHGLDLADCPQIGIYQIKKVTPQYGAVEIQADNLITIALKSQAPPWEHVARSPQDVLLRTLQFAGTSTDFYDASTLVVSAADVSGSTPGETAARPTSHHRIATNGQDLGVTYVSSEVGVEQTAKPEVPEGIDIAGNIRGYAAPVDLSKNKMALGEAIHALVGYTYHAFVPGGDGVFRWVRYDASTEEAATLTQSDIADLEQDEDARVITRVTTALELKNTITGRDNERIEYTFTADNIAAQTRYATESGDKGIFVHEIRGNRFGPKPFLVRLNDVTTTTGTQMRLVAGLVSGVAGISTASTTKTYGDASWDTGNTALRSTAPIRRGAVVFFHPYFGGTLWCRVSLNGSARLTTATDPQIEPNETSISGSTTSTTPVAVYDTHTLLVESITDSYAGGDAEAVIRATYPPLLHRIDTVASAAPAVDTTILEDTSYQILNRFRYGAISLRLRTPLHNLGIELGDILKINHPIPLAFGHDGDTADIKYEVVRREIRLGDTPGVTYGLCQVADDFTDEITHGIGGGVPPTQTGFVVDSLNQFIVDSYGNRILAS